ncbi:hypothetical protein NA78x_000029 [Anatilimnocola sp. NA78]|uniref:hypothetical protein n=1 Tax=Anatilimnocola sp. NA78 TaxID=3415683 RepID=UPI003CE5AE0D
MNSYLLVIGLAVVVLTVLWFWLRRRLAKLDAEWEAKFPRTGCKYCGNTLLFYDLGHGNQIEYLDPGGRCYLWYPGNPVILVGKWRVSESSIYFQYGLNTYNPVMNVRGGSWEEQSIDHWSSGIVDRVPGDVFGIKRSFPFVLKSNPPLNSLSELRLPEEL